MRRASHLDAFSAYPGQTQIPSSAPGGTTGKPEVCTSRSSRTSDVSTQNSRRRYELLGGISLLSPEYLLSFERRSFHTHPPDHYAPVSCLLGMSPSQSSALMPLHSMRPVTNRSEGTFGSLRYAFGGDHPSQTTHQAMSAHRALDFRQPKGRISRMAPQTLACLLQSLRPILHIG